MKTARRRLEALAGSLDAEYPSAAASIREGLDELFTVKRLGLCQVLERSLSTTNAIENVNNGIRRIAGRVKRWRGGSMILRWIGDVTEARPCRRFTSRRWSSISARASFSHTAASRSVS